MAMPTVKLEVAFSSDPDSTSPNYVDISSRLLSFSTSRGRQYELDEIQPGTCTVRLNNGDRALDPAYTYSPFYPYVVPMRKLRLSATWSGTTYYLFTGFIESWPIVWDTPTWGSVTVTAIDAFAALSQALISGTFAQELTGSRINDVLAAASWPTQGMVASTDYWALGTDTLDTTTKLSFAAPLTSIDTGWATVQAVTIAATDNVSALQHIQAIAAADPGTFFVDGSGNLVFQDRHHRYNTASQVTFTDGSTSSSRLPYQQLLPSMDVTRVVNEVTVTATPGGVTQTADDGVSQKQNFRRTLALSPPLVTDAAAADLSQYELWLHKTPLLRFDALTVMPQGNSSTWPHALGRELGDKVTVERTPATRPAVTSETITRQVFIEAIHHTGTPGSWQTSYQLSPADVFGAFFTLDTANLDSALDAALAY